MEAVRAMAYVRGRRCGSVSFLLAYFSNTEYCSRCSDQLPAPRRAADLLIHPRTLPNPPQSSGWRPVEDVTMTLQHKLRQTTQAPVIPCLASASPTQDRCSAPRTLSSDSRWVSFSRMIRFTRSCVTQS